MARRGQVAVGGAIAAIAIGGCGVAREAKDDAPAITHLRPHFEPPVDPVAVDPPHLTPAPRAPARLPVVPAPDGAHTLSSAGETLRNLAEHSDAVVSVMCNAFSYLDQFGDQDPTFDDFLDWATNEFTPTEADVARNVWDDVTQLTEGDTKQLVKLYCDLG
jgi:hypothetical protein